MVTMSCGDDGEAMIHMAVTTSDKGFDITLIQNVDFRLHLDQKRGF